MRHDTTIAEIAAQNHGLLPKALARERGVPLHVVERLARARLLVRVQPSIWRLASAPATFEQEALGAVLAAGFGACLSHRSAARVLGLLERAEVEHIDITVPRDRSPRLRGVSLHRSLDLVEAHVRVVDGLRVTTPERTLADLGDVLPRRRVAWALERAVIERHTTIDRLWRMLDEIGRQGRNGRGALREALEAWMFSERPPDSVLEVMFARVVRQRSLPLPTYQAEIRAGGRLIARVDALWEQAKLIAEVDGLHAHAAAARLQHDLERQNALVALGYTVLRFTWTDVVQRPGHVAALLARQLERAGAA